jgi:dTDP-4-dehydrorhamnose 3,5-epimerase
MGKIKIIEEKLGGALLMEPSVFFDNRGFFMETYNIMDLKELGVGDVFKQDNQSYSIKNVLRGLHFQKNPHPTSKLVRCIKGEIFDVVVDLRRESPTFKKWKSFVLSEENKRLLYVPIGFAHGFYVLSDGAVVSYKVSEIFYKECDAGVRWNDPDIGVEWPISSPIISDKDANLPFLKD